MNIQAGDKGENKNRCEEQQDDQNIQHSVDATPLLPNGVQLRQNPLRKIVVEPLILLYMLANTIELPIMEQFIYVSILNNNLEKYGNISRSGDPYRSHCYHGNDSQDFSFAQHSAQAEASTLRSRLELTRLIPGIFSAMFLGACGDKFGRKIPMLVPLYSKLMRIIFLSVVITFELSLNFLYAYYVFDGICGSGMILFAACYAYLSDTTEEKHRTFRMVMLVVVQTFSEGLVGIGIGYWIRAQGYFYPNIPAAILILVAIVYTHAFVPEINLNKIGESFSPKIVFTTFRDAFRIFAARRNERRPLRLICLFLGASMYYMGRESKRVDTLFAMNTPLCWDSVSLAYFACVQQLVSAIGSVVSYCMVGVGVSFIPFP